MKSTVSRKTVILIVLFLVILATGGTVAGYLYGRISARGESIKQYLLTEDVEPGHSLKGKYKEAYVSSKTSLDLNKLVINSDIIDSSVAATYLYANSPITVTNIKELEDLERNIEVSFPVTVTGSVANSIKPGDMVAIKLTYKDENKEDAVVVPQIRIKDVRSTNGTPIEDNKTIVGFVIFDVTNSESSDVNNAMKEGSLYCAKYNDLNQKPLEKTYRVSDSVVKDGEKTDEESESN